MANNQDSILDNTKKVLGFEADYRAFDLDIMRHINTAFNILESLGVGPNGGYMIEGHENTWDEFTQNDKQLNSVKTYVYIKTRLLFDPPGTSYVINSFNELAKELEWRLQVHSEGGILDTARTND